MVNCQVNSGRQSGTDKAFFIVEEFQPLFANKRVFFDN